MEIEKKLVAVIDWAEEILEEEPEDEKLRAFRDWAWRMLLLADGRL